MSDQNKKVVVIGGGPGGYAAAFRAADLGLEVTLVDPEDNPGGVCLYRGCIPSKALLHVAKLIHESEQAEAWGLSFAGKKIDIKKMRDWKNGIVNKLTGGLGQLAKKRKIDHIRGRAKFLGPNEIEIDLIDGKTKKLKFDKAIIATGSRPAVIPSLNIKSKRILDSTGALELESIPKSLLVVGGGYIGLELGTVYAALGAEVSVVEMLDGLLPGADRDLVGILQKSLEKKFKNIWLNTTVKKITELKTGLKVEFDGKDIETKSQMFEKVLISVGRKPNSSDLGLKNTLVEIDDHGFIKVDSQRRTAEKSIFAIGDVAGEPMLAHKASHEGIIAAEAIAGHKVAFEPQAIPAVVFTDPEIAWCGVTQKEAKEKSLDVEITRFPWAASGRALTLDRTDGVTKMIFDKKTGRVLGVGIAGPGAGEMIAEGVLAVEMAALASDVSLSIHPHPTLSETIMEAAELFTGSSTHYHRPKRG